MEREYDRALDLAAADGRVKAVLVRGKGEHFSSGHDLKESAEIYGTIDFSNDRGDDSRVVPAEWTASELPRVWSFYKPLIAAVHGYVGPAAWDMLPCCDFVITAEGSTFSREIAALGTDRHAGLPDHAVPAAYGRHQEARLPRRCHGRREGAVVPDGSASRAARRAGGRGMALGTRHDDDADGELRADEAVHPSLLRGSGSVADASERGELPLTMTSSEALRAFFALARTRGLEAALQAPGEERDASLLPF